VSDSRHRGIVADEQQDDHDGGNTRMRDRTRRKELQAHYKQTGPEAGVYRIVNGKNHKVLLGSTLNLASAQSKLVFWQRTGVAGVLDRRLGNDVRAFGIDAFSFEVLEVLDIEPGMTNEQIRRDLATLEALWRENLDPAFLY
jgi:hypothetical protein